MISTNINNSASSLKHRKHVERKYFTREEDEKLMKLIEKLHFDWKKISKEMTDRTVRQCKDRYFHYLSPNIYKEKWTKEEEDLLLSSVESNGKKWKMFEKIFNGRTEIDIRNRFNILMRRNSKDLKYESPKTIEEKFEDDFNLEKYNQKTQINIQMNDLQSSNQYISSQITDDSNENNDDTSFLDIDLSIGPFDDFLTEFCF